MESALPNRILPQPIEFSGSWGANPRTIDQLDEKRVRCQNIEDVCLLAMTIAVVVIDHFLNMGEFALIPIFFFATIIIHQYREEKMLAEVIKCARLFKTEGDTVDPKIVQKCWEFGCIPYEQLIAWQNKISG